MERGNQSGIRYAIDRCMSSPEEYGGQEEIAIACTQLADSREQGRLVKAWSEALPTMTRVRRIGFRSHFPRRLFDAVCSVPNLEALYIKWSNLQSLAPIVRAKKLQSFHLGSSPSVIDPESLRGLKNLRYLWLENIPALYDLEWIAEMTQLEELNLCGGVGSTQRIASLRPLVRLSKLHKLSLNGARVADKTSIMALAELPNLADAEVFWYWPKGVVKRLAQARPDMIVNDQRWPDWQDMDERGF
jgi:hypothetical protein